MPWLESARGEFLRQTPRVETSSGGKRNSLVSSRPGRVAVRSVPAASARRSRPPPGPQGRMTAHQADPVYAAHPFWFKFPSVRNHIAGNSGLRTGFLQTVRVPAVLNVGHDDNVDWAAEFAGRNDASGTQSRSAHSAIPLAIAVLYHGRRFLHRGCAPRSMLPGPVEYVLTSSPARAAQTCVCAVPDAVENFAALR
jgi:hypothetical protein